MKAGSKPGVRTIGVMPTRSAAITMSCTSRRSKLVCSRSMKAASKPGVADDLHDLRIGDAADVSSQRHAAFAHDPLGSVLLHIMSFY